MKSRSSIEKLVGTALLAALVLLLQFFVVIPIGAYNITLTLVPIMLGAILYGPVTGAVLGGVFGLAVTYQVFTGLAGALSTAMLQLTPVVTVTVCLLKGILAGLVAGLIYKPFQGSAHKTLGVILSAISCPIVNTGIFVSALFLFYYNLMAQYAAENAFAGAVTFVFIGIVGLNFVVEFVINVLLIPLVLRLMKILKITTV